MTTVHKNKVFTKEFSAIDAIHYLLKAKDINVMTVTSTTSASVVMINLIIMQNTVFRCCSHLKRTFRGKFWTITT
jgi:hypothetical protein